MQQQQFLTDCQLLIRDACDATSRHYKTTRLQTASTHRQYQSAPLLGSSDADACKSGDFGYDDADDDGDDDDDEQQQHSALHLANLCKDCCAAALLPYCFCTLRCSC